MTIWDKEYCPHFTGEETKAQVYTAITWWGCLSKPGHPASKLAFSTSYCSDPRTK